jgi:hypothetical protein
MRDGAPDMSHDSAHRPTAFVPVWVAGFLCAGGYLLTSPVVHIGPLTELYQGRHLLVVALRWAFFLTALGCLHRYARSRTVQLWVLVLAAAACQLPGLLVAPQSSSDAYRYVLDGRTQLAGISPYRYAPLDDHLARLRDPLLFPGLTPAQHSGVTTPPRIPTDPKSVAALTQPDPRTLINRPDVPTIYPPVAEAWFTAVAAVTPWSAGTRGLQWAGALLALAVMIGLGLVLRRRHGTPLAAVYWGWAPPVVLETGNNAHVDVVAAALIVAAMLVLDRPNARRQLGGGILIGLAIATKIIPLLVLPAVAVIRRGRGGWTGLFRVPVPAFVTAALSYLPHILVAGSLVLGYLPGYLTEEGFSDGQKKYAILGLVLPRDLRGPVALLLMLALAVFVLRRASSSRPEHGALLMYGGALLITTPEYPWYGLPLLGLAALARRPEWLAVAVATQWSYTELHASAPVGWGYLAAAVIVAAATWARSRAGRSAGGRSTSIPDGLSVQELLQLDETRHGVAGSISSS